MGMNYDKPNEVVIQKQDLKLDHLNEVWDSINEKYFNKNDIESDLAENYAIKGVYLR